MTSLSYSSRSISCCRLSSMSHSARYITIHGLY